MFNQPKSANYFRKKFEIFVLNKTKSHIESNKLVVISVILLLLIAVISLTTSVC